MCVRVCTYMYVLNLLPNKVLIFRNQKKKKIVYFFSFARDTPLNI